MNAKHASLLAGALALSCAGCLADNTVSLIVVQNQVLDPTTSCAVPATATTTSESAGILDVGMVEGGYDGYFVYPLVLNNLVDRGDPAAGVASADSISIEGAQVELQGALTSALSQTSFSLSTFGGTIVPTATAGLSVNAIPKQLALELGAQVSGTEPSPPSIVARFRVTGVRAGGELDSGWVNFPVEICRWCLTGGQPPPCPSTPPQAMSVVRGACNPSQDLDVTCCTAGSELLCGSRVPVASM